MHTEGKLLIRTEWKRFEVTFLTVFTLFFFCRLSFLNFAKAFGIPLMLMVNVIVAVMLVFGFLYTFSSEKNICWDGIVVILAAWLFFELTLVFHPEYQYRYLDELHSGRFSFEAVFSFGSAIYAYYVIRLHAGNPDHLYRIYRFMPYALLFLNIGTLLFNRSDAYSMDFGYQMALAAMLFMAVYLHEKSKPHRLILSFCCIAAGVLYGSRACIIGYGLFIVLYFIWQRKMTARLFAVFALAAAALTAFFSQTVMMWIYRFFSGIGLNSRTLYLLAQGNILAADTARQDKIWPALFSILRRTPLFKAYGAYGGRYHLASNWAYEHNIVFEMLFTFGIILGSLILIVLIVTFVRVLIKDRSTTGLLTLVFGCFSLSRLFLSNTFWQEAYFWAFLAMLVNASLKIRKERNAKRSENAAAYERSLFRAPEGEACQNG